MDIVEVTAARRFSRERANRIGLIDRPRLVCDLVCLEPGQREPRRDPTASDEMYYIIEGKGVVRIGQHEYEISAGQALVVPPQMEHWLTNPGPGRVSALALLAPKPGREAEVGRRAARDGQAGRARPGGGEGRRPARTGPRPPSGGEREAARGGGRGRPAAFPRREAEGAQGRRPPGASRARAGTRGGGSPAARGRPQGDGRGG
ncbi:MAG TPA: cupin domain-containing protein, partial [Dehalococcoidia bacterium]|nr:cupin domain-containing protein [Dehalococcoidia bacterium]